MLHGRKHGVGRQPVFNSGCPYHTRRCKCSSRVQHRRNETLHNGSKVHDTVINTVARGASDSGGRRDRSNEAQIRSSSDVESPDLPIALPLLPVPAHGSAERDHAAVSLFKSSSATPTDTVHPASAGIGTGGAVTRPPSTSIPDTKICNSLQSLASQRDQLRMVFLNHYLPSHLPSSRWLAEKYNRWFDARSLAMRAAVDCCLLLHCAAMGQDLQAANQGRKLHAKAVRHLRTELTRSDSRNNDELLCTISMLALCCRLRRQDETDQIHYDGFMAVLATRKAHTAVQSELARDLVLNLMPRALTLAVQRRRRFLLGEPEWQQALAGYCATSPIKQIVLISCRIPNVLHARDQLVLRQPSTTTCSDVCMLLEEAYSMKRSLEAVLASWHAQSQTRLHWEVGVDERFPQFTKRMSNNPNAYPFISALDYSDPPEAIYHNWYRVALLGVYTATLELLSLLHEGNYELARTYKKQSDDMMAECEEAVDAICRTIPFIYCNASARRYRSSLWSQVLTARQWYEQLGDTVKKQWCDALLKVLEEEDDSACIRQDDLSIDQVFAGWMMLIP